MTTFEIVEPHLLCRYTVVASLGPTEPHTVDIWVSPDTTYGLVCDANGRWWHHAVVPGAIRTVPSGFWQAVEMMQPAWTKGPPPDHWLTFGKCPT